MIGSGDPPFLVRRGDRVGRWEEEEWSQVGVWSCRTRFRKYNTTTTTTPPVLLTSFPCSLPRRLGGCTVPSILHLSVLHLSVGMRRTALVPSAAVTEGRVTHLSLNQTTVLIRAYTRFPSTYTHTHTTR